MYKSLEEICEMTTKEGKPFWKIVQEDDCREQGISEGEAFEQMRGMYQAMREADDNYDGKLRSGGNRRGKNACSKRSRNFALWKIYWKSDGKSFKDR